MLADTVLSDDPFLSGNPFTSHSHYTMQLIARHYKRRLYNQNFGEMSRAIPPYKREREAQHRTLEPSRIARLVKGAVVCRYHLAHYRQS